MKEFPGGTLRRRGRSDQHARVEKQPHVRARSRRMSASSSAIQPAISSGVNVRGSGSGAPSARSRDAKKSISSCFSAGESPAAADSISASVTIGTSVHRTAPTCQGNPQTASPLGQDILPGICRRLVRTPAAWCEVTRASDSASPWTTKPRIQAKNAVVLDPTRGFFTAPPGICRHRPPSA